MGRLGIRIANIALFTLCCFQLAAVFNRVSADLLMPGPSALASNAAPVAVAARSWSHRQPILDRNLFGAQMFAEIVPEVVVEEELEKTKLPLRLLGTQVHSVGENSKAAVTDKSGRFRELLYVGDALERHPQARLVKIERGRVILENQGRREELLLAEVSHKTGSIRTDRRSRNRRRTSRAKPPPKAPLTERLRALKSNANQGRSVRELFNQAKIIPKWDDNEMVGMELREIESGSLYEKMGLNEGDVITSFNGVQLDSAAAGARVLSKFVEADEFEIELAGGEVMNLSSAELTQLLESTGEEE